ncbi:S-adenosyl-L-methionine-dependent methyltransferase [Gonapodya prolifera JEL478]|uniref:S-adenosyl-L-methionine-dependent methyltransferase n=1 Tax=Gonapodya prolifera (strain JEL478) TaxID=1344416 RepID=A0A139AJU3_GONPJ|nr:S-adenosyl-L-methionine-dependent methyltransferase [Gonapodya prolifera JEL478]|eukprot:KXS16824.1 S-adenosyl-L-methionine-dependent methyltransferase [Gonapodya prolifera JEL478]
MAVYEAQESQGHARSTWSVSDISAYYKDYSRSYDDEIDSDRSTYPAPFIISRWVLDYLTRAQIFSPAPGERDSGPIHPGSCTKPYKILDLGCGTGQSSAIFLSDNHAVNFNVDGIDATKEMLEKAAKRGSFRNLICGDIERELRFPDVYDGVVCVGVMDFVRDPEQLLRRVFELVKPGHFGVFGVTFPELDETSELSAFTRSEMEKLIRRTDWYIERHERFPGYKDSQSNAITAYHGFLLSRR